MIVAYDKQGNRLYAGVGKKYKECFCPVCGEELIHKPGKGERRPHFAHKGNTECTYGKDKDHKSDWHIRMQEYFPEEAREVRFDDKETGEKHIADIFVESCNTVLEIQHSPIDPEEFLSRTLFHLKNGRRIAWLFDESSDSENASFGKFKKDDCEWEDGIYAQKSFKWAYKRRKAITRGPDLKQAFDSYSICVYTGTEGDVFHRIVGEHCLFDYVTFSLDNIEMSENTNIEDFFRYDLYWVLEDRKRINAQSYQKISTYIPVAYRPRYAGRKRKRRFYG